MTSLFVEE